MARKKKRKEKKKEKVDEMVLSGVGGLWALVSFLSTR